MGVFGKKAKEAEAEKKEQEEMNELLQSVLENARNLAGSINKVGEKLHSATDSSVAISSVMQQFSATIQEITSQYYGSCQRDDRHGTVFSENERRGTGRCRLCTEQ